MAGEKIDILIVDNKPELDYISLLRQNGYNVELARDLSEETKKRICSCNAKVFIFGYMLSQTSSIQLGADGSEKAVPSGISTGIDIAETIRLWERGETARKKYIHIVSSCAVQEKPYFSDLSWKEWMKKGTIDSYSTRDVDNFRLHLQSIEDALKE